MHRDTRVSKVEQCGVRRLYVDMLAHVVLIPAVGVQRCAHIDVSTVYRHRVARVAILRVTRRAAVFSACIRIIAAAVGTRLPFVVGYANFDSVRGVNGLKCPPRIVGGEARVGRTETAVTTSMLVRTRCRKCRRCRKRLMIR